MHRTARAALGLILLLSTSTVVTAASEGPQTQPLDYDSSLRCHALLKYFADLNGEQAHPSVREGVAQARLLARLYGEERGKSLETTLADLASEVTRQHQRLEATDLSQESAVTAIGAEINQCLQLIAATQ